MRARATAGRAGRHSYALQRLDRDVVIIPLRNAAQMAVASESACLAEALGLQDALAEAADWDAHVGREPLAQQLGGM